MRRGDAVDLATVLSLCFGLVQGVLEGDLAIASYCGRMQGISKSING